MLPVALTLKSPDSLTVNVMLRMLSLWLLSPGALALTKNWDEVPPYTPRTTAVTGTDAFAGKSPKSHSKRVGSMRVQMPVPTVTELISAASAVPTIAEAPGTGLDPVNTV